jgi:thiol-disulfide isomerase/thioredoxin
MGKAERIRRMNAREKIAAQQAAARQMEARRRMFLAGGSVLAVLVIVVVLIIVKGASNTGASSTSASGHAASSATTASVTRDITSVPASTLNAVGKGSGVSPLIATKGQPALTSGSKPEIVYMGAEYCPYCAAERWAMAVALSRFGTFSGLHLIHSSNNDVYTNTATLSFYKSTYTSKYLVFNPVEMYSEKQVGNGYATLQKPTATENSLMSKYDGPPYVPSTDSGSFPFVDIGNQYLVIGAQYLPSTLGTTSSVDPGHFGLTWTQIASDLKNPASPVAQGIDGTANSITAAICKITNNADTAVCSSAAATAGAGSL